jgi:DNA-binding transcriptional LysR family regulator
MHEIHLERFDLNLLLLFDTLMRERHAGRAGEALGLTQPAVSHALTRLRQLLDDPLFIKHAKGMRPTPRAEALAGPIASALRLLRAALNEEQPFDPAQSKRTIAIGGSDYIDFALMPKLLPSIREAAPGFNVRLRSVSQETVSQELRRREIDIAIGPVAAAPEGVELTPLFTERLVLIARLGHPALRKNLTPEIFAGLQHLLVSPRGDPFGLVDRALREAGLSRRVAITVPHFFAAPFIIGATDLVALLVERVARRLAQAAGISVHEQPIAIPPWTIGVAHLPDALSDPAIKWLVRKICAVSSEI